MERTLETFIKDMGLTHHLKVYFMDPKDLIGKKVFSIRPGFSSSYGTVMIVDSISKYSPEAKEHFKLKDANNPDANLGWSTQVEECYKAFVLYDEEIYKNYMRRGELNELKK